MSSSGGSGRKRDEVHQLSKAYWREQREISPDRRRSIVWSAEPHDHIATSCKRVPVLYYLCRNGQLQHPHFMEVPLSSPQGLFLTDVISRLNVLRGKAMASSYSWSCKRSYKNGFVWHDLSENDFIYPAHGHEYVLKGSELPVKALLDAGSSSPPPAETQGTGADDLDGLQAADSRRRNHSCSSINFEYSVYTTEASGRSAAADASTQTDDSRRRCRLRPHAEISEEENGNKQQQRDECEIEISPPPSDSSPETLETLMKADGRPTVSPPTANENPTAPNTHQDHLDIQRCRSSVLMQLISCGSMPFKDCGAGQGQGQGLMGQYKMRVARGGGSAESGRGKVEYLSGSIVETKEEEFPALKRSTSYSADG
ncbi:UNVERIFIED_CONTAM: protein UPSTREAM OF FLC [Sesamum radiatum]|uniref:Protein UPSTREAM OF FLC n=1 Tax=Sesamum radiatum TaxID=300843 RepID=A0AAW2W3U8_SESRA